MAHYGIWHVEDILLPIQPSPPTKSFFQNKNQSVFNPYLCYTICEEDKSKSSAAVSVLEMLFGKNIMQQMLTNKLRSLKVAK